MAETTWDKLTNDFNTGTWGHTFCQIPLMEAKFRKFAEERGDAPWKVLDVGCGMGKHTLRVLKAGADYVLAFDVSKSMVDGTKMAVDEFLHSEARSGSAKVDCVVASATNCSSIPGAQEGTFDLALCVYVMCNLQSMEEVKQTFVEVFKMLKPGGKLFVYETHPIKYMSWDDKPDIPLLTSIGWADPKEDGTRWGYFEDEGKPREFTMMMNSGREIKFPTRNYTLSSWVSWIVGAGFHITELKEPYVNPKDVPADAPEWTKYGAGKPMGICWECTKPLSH
ncbi:hypothetical protein M758_8G164400 [Ceratodon purpureus]|nr:hypothetical protein M758_8G164400 [Ceratodon purpureus]